MSKIETSHKDLPSVETFKAQLINELVIAWVIMSTFGFVITEIRALQIGWTYTDLTFALLYLAIVMTTIFRHSLTLRFKAIILVLLNTSVAVAGSAYLGMMAGGIFFFPIAAVVLSLFYSRRVILISGTAFSLYLVLIGFRFVSGWFHPNISASELIRNPMHWAVYVICFGFFFIMTSNTILAYRKGMQELVEDVSRKSRALEESNTALQTALDEIKALHQCLPLCSYCQKIRADDGSWERVDVFIHKNYEAQVSHGICPDCMKIHHPDFSED